MKIIFTTSAPDKSGEKSLGLTCWGIKDGKLYRNPVPRHHFAAMCIDARSYDGGGDRRSLASEVLREAEDNCASLLLDLPRAVNGNVIDFCRILACETAERGITLYLPQHAADRVPGAAALVRTALCGGDLRRHIASALRSRRKAALDIDVMRCEFALPCRNGVGRVLSPAELRDYLGCGKYFYCPTLSVNYAVREGGKKLILFDDIASLRAKLALGEKLGCSAAFISLEQWNSIQ